MRSQTSQTVARSEAPNLADHTVAIDERLNAVLVKHHLAELALSPLDTTATITRLKRSLQWIQ